MSFKLVKKVSTEIEVQFLQVNAGVRYWEDTEVNNVEDSEDGDLIPCKDGDRWIPVIELSTGKVINWEIGKAAKVHYKVCDDGFYSLLDSEQKAVDVKECYVPKFLSPKEDNFGDYIILDIDESGVIDGWKFKIEDWQNLNSFDDE